MAIIALRIYTQAEMVATAHEKRIKRELDEVGVTTYGQNKMSSRYLPHVIHEDEHILGVVYGRSIRGLAMLVATNQRIIFLDRKPLYNSTDELTYNVVSGVQQETKALFSSVVLHTRIGDYRLTYVNPKCARIFVESIEQRIENLTDVSEDGNPTFVQPLPATSLTPTARDFLRQHELGVVSTASRTGELHGAVVNYLLGNDDCLYIVTKTETHKAHNIIGNSQVAMTVYDPLELITVQIQGVAQIEPNPTTKNEVFDQVVRQRQFRGFKESAPVAQLSAGAFIVFKIKPLTVHYRTFKNSDNDMDEVVD